MIGISMRILSFTLFQIFYKCQIVNKIIMDSSTLAISKIAASQLSEAKNAQKQLAEYQKNMKLFIQTVQKQTSALIDRYQTQIKQLKDQIKRLNAELAKKKSASHGFGFGLGIQSRMSDDCFSPIKHKEERNIGMDTIRSNFLQEFPIKNYFESDINNVHTSRKDYSYKFQVGKASQKLNKSRFQAQTKKKRQRQQDLLHYLETGRSNLENNTQKMFTLVGKSKNHKQIQKKNEQNQQQIENQNSKKKKGSLTHNASLSSICDSLNNSFHGKKAQAKSLKKKKQQQTRQLQQSRKQYQREKKKKQQGIVNLLTTMRSNIASSPDKPTQIIKGSKLLSTGEYKGKLAQASTKGKVMINPVPIDLKQRNKQKQHHSSTTSPSKNPQSILKNSSTNFLTKSIENISAISFYSEGGDQ